MSINERNAQITEWWTPAEQGLGTAGPPSTQEAEIPAAGVG